MKIETKRIIGAFIGYPITYAFGLFDKTEEQKRETKEFRQQCWDRICDTATAGANVNSKGVE